MFPGFDWCKNVVIFGVDDNSSVHIDNKKKKDILVLDSGPTQALDDTAITAEVKYSIDFFKITKKILFKS